MRIFAKKKNKKINYLNLTPIRLVECEESGDLVVLLVPKFRDWFFGKLLQPRIKDKYIRTEFDDFGSATWLLIDGGRNIAQIAAELEEKFGEKIQPVYDRLTEFLKALYHNGLIDFNEYR